MDLQQAMRWVKGKMGLQVESDNNTLHPLDGFDAPKTRLQDDRFGRTALARRMYDLLTSTPSNWSIRMGLFGRWGEGKTTTCNWIANLAEKDGHVVVWYNPWEARSDSDMWGGLASSLFSALDRRGIKIEGTAVVKWAAKGRTLLQQIESVGKVNKYAETAISLGASVLRVTPKDIAEIRKAIGDRRVLVIVDDTDRIDPQLLPKLLLAFRDVLDLPGFSFLLPFDHSVVKRILENYNKAWSDGELFLDKILDFRFSLPKTTADQRREVFVEEMARYCDFIAPSAWSELDQFLPENPRKLKAVVRNLLVFKTEALRHRADELDWSAMIVSVMIRIEAEEFYHGMTTKLFSESDSSTMSYETLLGKDDDPPDDLWIDSLLQKHPQLDDQTRLRLKILSLHFKSLFVQSMSRVRYTVRLLEQSELVTWQEYDRIFSGWKNSRSVEEAVHWVNSQASNHNRDAQPYVRDLLITVLNHYADFLQTAANTILLRDHGAAMSSAGLVLEFFEALNSKVHPEQQGETFQPVFERLLEVIGQWGKFNVNSDDQVARQREEEILVALAKIGIDHWQRIRSSLESGTGRSMEDGREGLFDDIKKVIQTRVSERSLQFLEKDGAILGLFAKEHDRSVRQELLNSEGPIWSPPEISVGLAKLREAPSNGIIQRNALHLLDIVQEAVRSGSRQTVEDASRFVKNEHLISSIWTAATANQPQHRAKKSFRDVRNSLIKRGAKAEWLPLPFWLEENTSR